MRIAAFLLLVASCGGGQRDSTAPAQPPPTAAADPWAEPSRAKPDVEAILARYAEFTAEVCKCTDNDCLERVTDERNRYSYAQKQKYGEHGWSAEDEAKAMRLREEYGACVLRIGKRDPSRPNPTEQKMIVPLAALRDEMCRCTDKPCVDRVRAAMVALMEDVGHMPLDDDQERRTRTISDEISKCALDALVSNKATRP